VRKPKAPRTTGRTSISKARTYEEIGEFWDAHDLADARPSPREAAFVVAPERRRFLVAVDPSLAGRLRDQALRRGLSSESLLNLWLKEKLAG
jgi:hypothetical protein